MLTTQWTHQLSVASFDSYLAIEIASYYDRIRHYHSEFTVCAPCSVATSPRKRKMSVVGRAIGSNAPIVSLKIDCMSISGILWSQRIDSVTAMSDQNV